ncbi:hypothetical protein GPECTOR_20g530 [Gonium pectorale]|uniref:Uncharacterized protein n=1 Tax=Gonium pectorale TaxID=33097 RepID=A0A150GIQ1_GONPE|nr:hypothetical protein GPECTOR_20g530 [Gonium pectorale]|eukprot:KXZ49673.1 hypothetical protein GPECTOR_20g530 [Gonium pectorale]
MRQAPPTCRPAHAQDAVRILASELHSKRAVLSFAMLADIVSSLETVLPLTGWPLREPLLLTDLLAQLPRATAAAAAASTASNASANAPSPTQLGELCKAFGSAHVLALRCAAGGGGRALVELPGLLEQLRQSLASEVLGNGHAALERLRGADMASMASAVRLANKYGAQMSQPFIDQLMARVSSMLSAATDSGASQDEEEGSAVAVHAARGAAGRGSRGRGRPHGGGRDSGRGSGRGGARGRVAAGDASGGVAASDGSAPAPDVTPASADKPADLDVQSLALLVRELCMYRSEGPGRPVPPIEWLISTCGAVLHSQDTAAVARRETLRQRLAAAQSELDAFQREELADLGPAPPTTQQVVDSGLLVAMLAKLGRCVRGRAGPELGRCVEAVVAQRLKDLKPQELVAALGAMAALGHTPVRSLTSSCLGALVPALPSLNTADASSLLASLKAFAYMPSRSSGAGTGASAAAGEPSGAAVIGGIIAAASNGAGGGGVGSNGPCDAWSAPFPADLLPRLEQVVERRVLRAVPESAMMLLSARYQSFAAGDMFTVALTDWQERGFAGLDEWSAGTLLGAFAHSPSSWVLWALMDLRPSAEHPPTHTLVHIV